MAAKRMNLGEETVATLSEDLISEILLRLPVMSLSRFRCVCKSWCRLIKSPNFIHMHLKLSKTLILVNRNHDEMTDIISFHAYETFDLITELSLDPYCKISGHCNGVLCLLDCVDQLALYNPSMEVCVYLPARPFPCPKGWHSLIQSFGFGFVSETNDYKVVSIIKFLEDAEDSDNEDDVDHNDGEDKPVNKVEIYDLSTGSWREIGCDCPYSRIDNYGTLFNGALHWIAREEEGIDVIPSFNLSTEVFRDIEFPNDILGKNEIHKSLTVVNDSLALFVYGYNSEQQSIDVWIMKEYAVTEYWTKQVSIGPLSGIRRPIMLWKNKSILLESSEGQLLSCDLDTHEMEEIDIRDDRGSIRVMVYQESLVSLE